MLGQMNRFGIEPRPFLPKKGQALIWHSGLVHGGSPVKDPSKTRNSFVVHYDALRKNRSETGM